MKKEWKWLGREYSEAVTKAGVEKTLGRNRLVHLDSVGFMTKRKEARSDLQDSATIIKFSSSFPGESAS